MTLQKRKKILFITGYFPFLQGGAEYQALLLAEQLKMEMDVLFIFRNHWGKPRIIKDSGYTLYGISPAKPKLKRGGQTRLIWEGIQLSRILRRVKPDVIYVRGANAYFMTASRYAHNANCRLVWHIASDPETIPFQYKKFFKNPFGWIEKKMVEYSMARTDCLIGQTYSQSDLLKKNYHKRCDTILRNWHPIPKETIKGRSPVKILWIANWKPIKQPDIFIALMKRLSSLPNIQLVMVGRYDGYQRLMTEAVNSGIQILGEVSTSQVNTLLSTSHLLVNTSYAEGFSNTFVQAWMNKVPVISLRVDPDGLLKNRKLGVCSGSFDKLVLDTMRLAEDHRLREQMGSKARAYAVEHHSLQNIKKMIRLLSV